MSSLRAAFAHRLATRHLGTHRAAGTGRSASPDRDRGAALLTTIGFVLMISAIGGGLAALVTSGTNNRIALTDAREQRYAADGAIEEAITTVRGLDRAGDGACTAPGGSTSSTINDRAIRVDWRNACGVVRTSSGDLVMQRNVVFSACADRGTSCAANEVIIRAQVNFEQAATGAVSRASVQSWNVNAVPAPSTTPWTPAQLPGLAMWLDASDASTLTVDAGAVSQWRDKSGNGRHLSPPASTNRPALVADGFNGRPTVRFDGVDDHLGTRSLPRTGDLNVLAVLRPASKSGQYHNVFDSAPLSGGPMLWVRGVGVVNSWELNTGSGLFTSNPWTGVAQVLGVRVSSSSPRLGIWVNGSSEASGDGTTGVSANPTSFDFFNRAGGQTFLGDASEVVWIDGTLSDADRQRLEGYLAHKWGTTASLPSNHPFKSAAPLRGELWTPAQLSGGTALWLDASDTSTFTTSGGVVLQWRDRSGNNRHANQALTSAMPARVDAALGGRPALVFDGTNDVLVISSYSVPQPYEMWAAFSLPVDPVAEADLWGSVNPVVVTRPRWQDGGSTRLVYAGGNLTAPRLTVGSHVWGAGFNGASSFDRLNGTLAATGNAGTWSLGGGTRIGMGQNTSIYLRATVGELLIVPASLSVADRERLEGYLAHKWGMAANLPANHPFKSAPPTV